MTHYQATLVIPICMAHDAYSLERELVERFGGYTRTATHGAWLAPDGSMVFDPSDTYFIALDETSLLDMRQFARGLKERLNQDAIYCAVAELIDDPIR